MMKFLFKIPPELLGPYILQEIPSYKLKIILKNPLIFEYVQNNFPCIIKDCFTLAKPISYNSKYYNNVHDMKMWLASEDIDLTNKVLTILNYEWCFVNPLKEVLKIIKDIDLKELNSFVENILDFTYVRTPETLVPLIKYIIDNMKYDPSEKNNYAIRYACRNGHLRIVELLLNDIRVDPSEDDNYAIRVASNRGDTSVVKLLLSDPRVNPSEKDNYAIQLACRNGHLQIVELLLRDSRVDPSANNNNAIKRASENGHTSVVELLLKHPKVDPSVNNNYLSDGHPSMDIR